MGVLNPFRSGAQLLRRLTPARVKALGDAMLIELVVREIPRARRRIAQLEHHYPSANRRELAQRLIDEKKSLAGMVGGVSGVFGLFSLPADLLLMVWLELVLLVDVATLYKANLKSQSQRGELLDLFAQSNGVGPFTRSTPRAVGTVAGFALARGGLKTVGRAVPLVAAPVSAWLNNAHVQRVGEAAIRHYEGFGKARRKSAEAPA
jgi:hypothetical protein